MSGRGAVDRCLRHAGASSLGVPAPVHYPRYGSIAAAVRIRTSGRGGGGASGAGRHASPSLSAAARMPAAAVGDRYQPSG